MTFHRCLMKWGIVCIAIMFLAACHSSHHGSSGDTGGPLDGPDGVVYDGKTDPVNKVKSDNAKDVGVTVTEAAKHARQTGGASPDGVPDFPSAVRVSQTGQQTASVKRVADISQQLAARHFQDFATGATHTEKGDCGGTADASVSGSMEDPDADATMDLMFHDYCLIDQESGAQTVVDGRAKMVRTHADGVTKTVFTYVDFTSESNSGEPPVAIDGQVSFTNAASDQISYRFINLTITDGDGTHTYNGTWTCGSGGCYFTESFVGSDEETVYQLEDVDFSGSDPYNVSGNVCHPEVGCFDFETTTSLNYCEDTGYPMSGEVAIYAAAPGADGSDTLDIDFDTDKMDDVAEVAEVPIAAVTFNGCSPTTVTVDYTTVGEDGIEGEASCSFPIGPNANPGNSTCTARSQDPDDNDKTKTEHTNLN